jgi:hypothetical protein
MPVYRVPAAITWNGSGSPGVNVWSVRTVFGTGGGTDTDLQDAVTALGAFYGALTGYFPAGMKVELGPDIIERTSLADASLPVVTKSSTSSVGPQALPPANQVVVGWRTALRARRGMGRTFIGPLLDTAQDTDGTVGTTFLNALTSAANTLLQASLSAANGYGIGVWGLENPGTYDAQGRLVPGQPHVHRDFTAFKIRDRFAVLRSRRD